MAVPERKWQVEPGVGEAVESAFREFGGHVYRFLLRRNGNHEDAEDLTQRVFAEAATALRERDATPDSMLAWLYTIAERRMIDEARRRSAAERALHLAAATTSQEEEFEYGRAAARSIRRCINRLPEHQRRVVVMKVIQGLAFSEIAAELEISVEACRMRLSRAIATLRSELEREGYTPDA